MFQAGAQQVWVVLGAGKGDIMQYYGDGLAAGGPMAHLLMERTWGMPYTLDQAWPWLNRDTVLFVMPDTISTPSDVLV
jgi:glucose-1-phosphate thymidylyltransferase